MGRDTCLEWLSPPGKSFASLGVSASDPWRCMVSHKSHVGVEELRAGGDPHRSEKPGWSASDTRQWPAREFCFLTYYLFKVSKMIILIVTCSKLAK